MAREDALTAWRVARSRRIEWTADLDAAQVGARSRFRDVDACRIRAQEWQPCRFGNRGRLLHERDLHLMWAGFHRDANLPVPVGAVALRLSLTIAAASAT